MSIQLPFSDRFTITFLDIINDLGIGLARILRKAYEHQSYLDNATQAVEGFLNEILYFEFPRDILEESYRTGFIARPFGGEFDRVGEALSQYFQDKKIRTRHFDPNLQGGLVIENIVAQIKESHFCIADISGNNPNVLLEVGIMISEGKPVRILRKAEMEDQLPFNVSGFQIYKYKLDNASASLQIAFPGEDRYRDFNAVINSFVDELKQNPTFVNAKPFEE